MKTHRPISRRSFLARVVGSAVAGGPALAIVAGRAAAQERQMVVDTDPADPARLPVTDRDEGATADPVNLGRGEAEGRRTGMSDADIGPAKDPPGQGRGRVRERRQSLGNPRPSVSPPSRPVSDSDSGANADVAGYGRSSGGGAPTSRFVSCPRHPRCPRGPGS